MKVTSTSNTVVVYSINEIKAVIAIDAERRGLIKHPFLIDVEAAGIGFQIRLTAKNNSDTEVPVEHPGRMIPITAEVIPYDISKSKIYEIEDFTPPVESTTECG